ncbi:MULTISPECIES: dihydropteroate synthase [Oceanobacillus]|uniref:Dihydropteroate synthase n=2 Tax=Oceanobacillus kimchii TaxID=746691 RepID=A0ABQ5TCK2_9BACI|nr:MULTISPECIES: dihydropteroate synthase [Oceanobacillus]MBT2599816.1 dihydropteroate synthase [Oceanobacillus sp. ISL-74]MBT2652734.1 dihydropteroate synthase [Oceanobacillus sp. ISL-73]MCT1577277.1 dihydropteroate synthase [Oceanobacillus kimchii]MCT2135347.1 dihydropteroate synthase [Oceanobacillus kimchii]OEH56610.1 dihydropteroate synthase [Oceanobacillus sp. E9]
MNIRTKKRTLNVSERTHLMGILNVTPDSFSDGGSYSTVDKAVNQALELEKQGADIIDIGGESTRPGYTPISAKEELDRIVPVIRILKDKLSIPISVDTFKAETAQKALEAGADIINDIWGAKKDPEMAKVVAKYNAPIILMHNRNEENYRDFMEDVKSDLLESIQIAKNAGITDDNIILDPGVGFAKSMEQNMEVVRELHQLVDLGYPVLLATSRKRFIGHVLDVPADERDVGTAATTVIGVQQGAHIVRVHNVHINAEAAQIADAIYEKGVSKNG